MGVGKRKAEKRVIYPLPDIIKRMYIIRPDIIHDLGQGPTSTQDVRYYLTWYYSDTADPAVLVSRFYQTLQDKTRYIIQHLRQGPSSSEDFRYC